MKKFDVFSGFRANNYGMAYLERVCQNIWVTAFNLALHPGNSKFTIRPREGEKLKKCQNLKNKLKINKK